MKGVLRKKGFMTWGKNMRYYNKDISHYVKHHDIRLFMGYTYKTEILEKGLSLIISPTCRIIREKNVFERYLDFEYEQGEQNCIFPFEQECINVPILCIHNQRIIKIDKFEYEMGLLSPFPDSKYKNYGEYYEQRYKVKFRHKDQFLAVQKKKTKNELG